MSSREVRDALVEKIDTLMAEVSSEAAKQLVEGDANRAQETVRALDCLRLARSSLYDAASRGYNPTPKA